MPALRTPEAIQAMMLGAYRTMPRAQAPAYRELFARLSTGRGPVVLNCTAGKDRTGIGAALVLTALGVPYATVRQDFLLSNRGIILAQLRSAIERAVKSMAEKAQGQNFMQGGSGQVVRPQDLQAMLEAIRGFVAP